MHRPGQSKRKVSKAELEAAVKRIDEQLAQVRSNQAKLEERAREYDEVSAVLTTLPERVAHPIMVPFGPLAFFEGQIERTNEVLTQLSSEWFALRTTKGALEMVGRRTARLRKDLADVKSEERELQSRRRVACDEGDLRSAPPEAADAPAGASVRYDEDGFLDIREPYEEEDGEVPQLQENASPSPSSTLPAEPQGAPAGDIFSRLRELERLEELEPPEDLEVEESPGEGGASSGAAAALPASVAAPGAGAVAGPAVSAPPQPQGMQAQSTPPTQPVKSPADLFNMMRKVEEEATESTSTHRAQVPIAPEPARAVLHPIQQGSQDAAQHTRHSEHTSLPRSESGFSGAIVERPGNQALPGTQLQTSHTASPGAQAEPAEAPKRVSKFKADRQRGRG